MGRRALMIEAAVKVIAEHGVAGLTHRLVAREAGVSLAATTYYFRDRFHIIAEASEFTLNGYTAALRAVAGERPSTPVFRRSTADLIARLVANAVARNRTRAVCWAEITLDASRHEQSLRLATRWFGELGSIWQDIALSFGASDAAAAARSCVDLIVGLMFVALGLGLTAEQVDAVFESGADPLAIWTPPERPVINTSDPRRSSAKSLITRERIVSSAIELLASAGPEAVNYRAVAARAGLTPSSPFYHFGTIDALLGAAQRELFEDAKRRYRQIPALQGAPLAASRVADRTAIIFQREATEFSGRNLASYAVWLEASRRPDLQPMVWEAILDQGLAWRRVLDRVSTNQRPKDAILTQALFIGKLVRLLATGTALEDLELVRPDFERDLSDISLGRFLV